jgi:hypothetical protein
MINHEVASELHFTGQLDAGHDLDVLETLGSPIPGMRS